MKGVSHTYFSGYFSGSALLYEGQKLKSHTYHIDGIKVPLLWEYSDSLSTKRYGLEDDFKSTMSNCSCWSTVDFSDVQSLGGRGKNRMNHGLMMILSGQGVFYLYLYLYFICICVLMNCTGGIFQSRSNDDLIRAGCLFTPPLSPQPVNPRPF